MKFWFWRLRLALAVVGRGHSVRGAWSYACSISEGESYADGMSPKEALDEDLSYAELG